MRKFANCYNTITSWFACPAGMRCRHSSKENTIDTTTGLLIKMAAANVFDTIVDWIGTCEGLKYFEVPVTTFESHPATDWVTFTFRANVSQRLSRDCRVQEIEIISRCDQAPRPVYKPIRSRACSVGQLCVRADDQKKTRRFLCPIDWSGDCTAECRGNWMLWTPLDWLTVRWDTVYS